MKKEELKQEEDGYNELVTYILKHYTELRAFTVEILLDNTLFTNPRLGLERAKKVIHDLDFKKKMDKLTND